jgi:soluble lytic murein transglycosylase-like protein
VVPPELAASPAFQRDRERFVADLVRTGRMSPARADSVATFVVREAYIRGVSPALVFGVMIAENAQFVSDTASNVGAVGLMQIYGKVWLKELGERFGTNLADDETNVRYGVFILSEYFKPRRGESTASAWNRGLLRYNGCVRGRNTPNCKTYPNKVRRHVEREAVALCAGKTYYDCIARPMIEGLTGKGVLD